MMTHKSLLLLAFLVAVTLCLKQSEIGRNDWHMENIGQLESMSLVNNKLFFLTKENVLGHLKLQTGEIQNRITLATHQRLLSATDRDVTFLTDNNQVINYKTHNLERNANNRMTNDKILRGLKSYVKSSDGRTIYVNDDKNLRAYPMGESESAPQIHIQVYTAQPNEILQKVFSFHEKMYVLMLKGGQFVFYRITPQNKLSSQPIDITPAGEFLEGWTVTQAFQSSGLLTIVLSNKALKEHETIIFTKDFTPVFQIPEMFTQHIHSQLIFPSLIYSLKEAKQVDSLVLFQDQALGIDYSLVDSEHKMNIMKSGYSFGSVTKHVSNLKLRHVWMFQKTSADFILVAQYDDMTLTAYNLQNGVQRVLWTRDQGLAFIDKVLFMKYPFNDHLDNEYHRNLFSQSYLSSSLAGKLMQVPFSIALRIREEIADLMDVIISSLQSLLDFSKLGSFDLKHLAKFTMSDTQELKLGLKKYIIAVTKTGTIYAIDTKTKKVLWRKYQHINSESQQIISLIDLRKDYQLQAAVLIKYDRTQKSLTLEQINQKGQIKVLDTIACPISPSIHKLNHESIIINMGDKTMRYNLGKSHSHEKHFYFYTEEKNRVVGWKQEGNDVVQVWNFNLDQGEKIIATASAYVGDQLSHIPLVDNGKVIFKNVDFTNLAILTSKNATSMSLFILNGMTGQVHFNQYRSGLNLNHPVNLAYDENNVIVTYYNNRNKLFEIWTVEQYQQRIENSPVSMIKDYLEGEEYKPSRNRENIIFLSEVYGSPVTIKKMFISESKESLIRRNLFIVTRDDKLYMIGRELVSTRRPKETALFSNEAYPPYQYLIPYEPAKFFSYNINLYGLKNVHFSPSDMQSTIFIMAYGTDIFMIRVAPDMPFDMITEDFNYLVLVLIMVGVTVGVIFLKNKAMKAKLLKPHRD